MSRGAQQSEHRILKTVAVFTAGVLAAAAATYVFVDRLVYGR